MSKNILNIQKDALDKPRLELLNKLLNLIDGFTLGGGTALALQINHRKSFDFDFFNENKIPKQLLEKLSQTIPVATVSVDTPDELTFFTANGIKVTFLYYPFKHAYPLETTKNGLKLFSVPDIAVKKAYTIGRRGEYRDYFDLYTILKSNYLGLPEIIVHAKKIYGNVFEEKIFLQQLVYFDDLLNLDIIPVAKKPLPKPAEVKSFFEQLVRSQI